MATCSYCKKPAAYVGDGQDGDLYCPQHKRWAPGTVTAVAEDGE